MSNHHRYSLVPRARSEYVDRSPAPPRAYWRVTGLPTHPGAGSLDVT